MDWRKIAENRHTFWQQEKLLREKAEAERDAALEREHKEIEVLAKVLKLLLDYPIQETPFDILHMIQGVLAEAERQRVLEVKP